MERRGKVALLRLSRPPVNAIELGLLRAAEDAFASLGSQGDTRALVVTGDGNCFSAGLDLKVVPYYGPEEQRDMIVSINRLIRWVYSFPAPLVAAINGHAIAGGLVLALACDYRVCAQTGCEVGLTEARAGIPFPAAATAVVKAELAPPVTRRLTLLGRNMQPQEALAANVVDEIQPRDRVLQRALEVAEDLATMPATGYERIKRQFRAAALREIEAVVTSDTDPLLGSWIADEGRTAASDLLATERRKR